MLHCVPISTWADQTSGGQQVNRLQRACLSLSVFAAEDRDTITKSNVSSVRFRKCRIVTWERFFTCPHPLEKENG